MHLPIFDTVIKGISVIGSIVGTREDLREVFRLHALGRTRVIAEGRKLADVNAAIDEVRADVWQPDLSSSSSAARH